MNYLLKILLASTILYTLSCTEEKNDPVKEKWELKYEKEKQLDSVNEKEALMLTTGMDAFKSKENDRKYTYQIKKIISDSSQLISITGYIKDIEQNSENYILKIDAEIFDKKSLFEISVSPDEFQELSKQLDSSHYKEGCFIFKPTKMKSSSLFKIDTKISGGDSIDDATAILTYDFDGIIYIFYGKLIGYYIYKELPDDE